MKDITDSASRGDLAYRRVEHVGSPELYLKLLAKAERTLIEILQREGLCSSD